MFDTLLLLPIGKTIGEDALPNQGLSSGETAVLKEFCKVFYAEIAEKLCLANEIVDVAAILCGITPQGDSSTSTSKMTTTFNEGLEHASSNEDFLNVFRSTVLRKSDDASKRLSMLTKECNFLTTFPAGSPLVMPLNGLHSSPRAIGPVDQDGTYIFFLRVWGRVYFGNRGHFLHSCTSSAVMCC